MFSGWQSPFGDWQKNIKPNEPTFAQTHERDPRIAFSASSESDGEAPDSLHDGEAVSDAETAVSSISSEFDDESDDDFQPIPLPKSPKLALTNTFDLLKRGRSEEDKLARQEQLQKEQEQRVPLQKKKKKKKKKTKSALYRAMQKLAVKNPKAEDVKALIRLPGFSLDILHTKGYPKLSEDAFLEVTIAYKNKSNAAQDTQVPNRHFVIKALFGAAVICFVLQQAYTLFSSEEDADPMHSPSCSP